MDTREIIENALRNYRCNLTSDDLGNGYPLVDALSPPGGNVDVGYEEIEYLADFIVGEIDHQPNRD